MAANARIHLLGIAVREVCSRLVKQQVRNPVHEPWRNDFSGAIVTGGDCAAKPLSFCRLRNHLPKLYSFFTPLLRTCVQITRMS